SFGDRRNVIESNINNIKAQKESLKDNKDYTSEQKKEIEGSLNAQLSQLEGAKKQLDAIDKKFGGSADIMGRFNMALSEMGVKLEEVTAKAKNAFNKSEVNRLESKKSGRKTDEFASQNTAVQQAMNEEKKATAEYTGTKKTIEEVDKIMSDPTVKREISKIAINGKSIDGETSAQQLEQAKVGRTEKEKTQIDKLITRRKAIDSLPELKKAELEAEDKKFNAKSALELEKVDRKTKVREVENKEMESAAQVRFAKEQLGSKVNERDVSVRQAEISKVSADLGVASTKTQIQDIDGLFKQGKISKEEYTKRSIDLRSQLADATTKAAQAELAVEQAKNKRILDLWEENIKKRQVGRKETEGAATIGLIQAQKGNRMNESDVAVKKAELQEISAKGDVSEIKKQMSEVDALRKKGVITEQEHTKRKLDMRSQLVDANIKAAEAELAIEQAKNRKILSDWERTIKARELATKRTDTAATLGLIAGQRGNRMSEDEVSVKKAEIQATSSKSNLANLESQLSELDSLRSKGVLTEEEHAKRRMDLESSILDAKVRSAEAELAIEQAKNRKIINEIDKVKQAKLFLLDTKQGYADTDAKYAQLNGGRVGKGGERGAMERAIEATKQRLVIVDDAVNNDRQLYYDGTLSEKEYTDRSQAGENAVRSEEEKLVNLLIQQRQAIYQEEHDAFTRANNGIIRGLEARKTRSTMESQLDGAKQGYAESAVGLSRAKADNAIAQVEATKPQGKSRDAEIANIRLQSLQSIQAAEMLILGLKEKQQQAALKQAEIEAQIAYGKQRIAVSESERKLKEARLTGDENAIANASSEVITQRELLGLEGEKLSTIGMQSELARAKMGIDRQTAKTSMDTELTRAQTAVGQFGSGQIQQNKVIGGGSFGPSGGNFGVDLSALNRIGAQNAIKPITIDPMISRIQAPAASVDRTVDRSASPVILDDTNIVGAINKLGEKLGRLAPQREQPKIQQRQPGYSDYLEADTASAFMRG
ncbi:MAG: SHOCT domain-containing protein, partial [Microcoleus sp.]